MTTNNLIGYDPLAWMDGEVIEEIPPVEIVKKATKSRAKVKVAPLEIVEKLAIEPIIDVPEDVEIDVKIEENSDVGVVIDVVIDAEEHADIEFEISTDSQQTDEEVIDQIVDEVNEMSVETVEMEAHEGVPEEIAEPLIELGSDATIKHIAKLYDTIKLALAAHDTIEINASNVTTIDTATLQLLVSLKKDAPRLNKKVDIIYPSARFIESAKLLNLLDVLDVIDV
jgi:ABC-type transporter Mla MlaB component